MKDTPLHVVIGGSSHIGRVLCEHLSNRGRRVLSTFFKNPLSPVEGVTQVQCDVTSKEACEELALRAFEMDQHVFLTYMPASKVDKVCHRLAVDDWLRVMDVNLNGAFLSLSAFLRRMRPQGFGRVVLIGSVSGRIGAPGTAAYSASKEALRGLSRTAAIENAGHGITVNYIELGFMNAGLSLEIPPGIQEGFRSVIPVHQFGDPINVSEAILFLERADYVTGSNITISGGL